MKYLKKLTLLRLLNIAAVQLNMTLDMKLIRGMLQPSPTH